MNQLLWCSTQNQHSFALTNVRVSENTGIAAWHAASAAVQAYISINKANCNTRVIVIAWKISETAHPKSNCTSSLLTCQNHPPAVLSCLKQSPKHVMGVNSEQPEDAVDQLQLQTMTAALHSFACTFGREPLKLSSPKITSQFFITCSISTCQSLCHHLCCNLGSNKQRLWQADMVVRCTARSLLSNFAVFQGHSFAASSSKQTSFPPTFWDLIQDIHLPTPEQFLLHIFPVASCPWLLIHTCSPKETLVIINCTM